MSAVSEIVLVKFQGCHSCILTCSRGFRNFEDRLNLTPILENETLHSIYNIANWNPISGVLSTISGVILVMVQEVFGCTIRCVNAVSGFILGAVPRSV